MAINLEQLKAVNWIEEWWLRKHEFPPVGALKNFLPDFDLEEALKNEVFLASLDNRGIKLPRADQSEHSLTNEQLAAIALMSNFRDPRSPSAKLRSIGVTWTKWHGWMRDKHFKEYLQDLCAVNFNDSMDVAQRGILSSVEKGNIDAVKFYLEVTGRYTPQSQELANVKLVLSKLLETIQIHVKDPNVLRSIASDFERVIQGGDPTQPKELLI
jgi:hypothetical protein